MSNERDFYALNANAPSVLGSHTTPATSSPSVERAKSVRTPKNELIHQLVEKLGSREDACRELSISIGQISRILTGRIEVPRVALHAAKYILNKIENPNVNVLVTTSKENMATLQAIANGLPNTKYTFTDLNDIIALTKDV